MLPYWVLLLVSLAFGAVGFYKYIYFTSVGYGLSVAALGVALVIGERDVFESGDNLAALLLVLYGLRLAAYTLIRERSSRDYRRAMAPEIARGQSLSIVKKALVWIGLAVLHTLQVLPLYLRAENFVMPDPLLNVGMVVMLLGLALETAADLQKSAAKRRSPNAFVGGGLYRIVRCPNYLGEIIFWLGVLLLGIPALDGLVQWVFALLGFALTVCLMFNSARQLELRQIRRYGRDPKFRRWAHTVPILLPLLPIYTLRKRKAAAAEGDVHNGKPGRDHRSNPVRVRRPGAR